LNIVVCIKRVPDTETRIKIGQDGKTIDPSGVKYIISPYDEFAIEGALRQRDQSGAGEVTLMTVGDVSSGETLRKGLAMGADRAVLLEGQVTADGLATAKALTHELESLDAGLILLGTKAADNDQQQVGPMVATLLGRPCATNVAKFEVTGDTVTCHREVEGGSEQIELDLPAVLTITKGAFEPRLASLKGIMAAKRKPLEQKAARLPDSRLDVEVLSPPPARPEGRVVGEGTAVVTELVRLLREEAGVL
jgi:electron transfer flavoprotein beta subunit